MGEKLIEPKFNVNEKYRNVNILNPYRFGGTPPSGGYDTADLISYYSLENDITSETGAFDGTNATSLTYTTGVNGQAGSFNGTTSYYQIPTNVIANLTNYSFSLFVKLNTTATEMRIVFNDNLNGGYNNIKFNKAVPSNIEFTMYTSNGYFETNTTGHNLLNWTHVTVTVAPTEFKIYVDSVLITTFPYTGTLAQIVPQRNVVGTNRALSGNYLDGLIDGLGIWSKTLTDAEVGAIYLQQNTVGELL